MSREREPLPTHVRETPPLPPEYSIALRRGLAALHLELDALARDAIDGHVRLLLAWTSAINLTAIRGPAAVAIGHVVDSLTAIDWLRRHEVGRLLDMGSGGGFPGVPLAAVRPGLEVTLVEPIAKKARFLSVSAAATGLAPRVSVVATRAEDLARDEAHRARWPLVTARAVGSMADLVELAFPLLVRGGALLAWKRGELSAELAAAERAIDALGGGAIAVHDPAVDDLAGHVLVEATRSGDVPAAYPRDPSLRRRRPW